MDIKEAKNRQSNSIYRHPWELARIEIVKHFLNKITKNTRTEEITVIDIGCGDLFVLDTIGTYFNFKALIGVDKAFDSQAIKSLISKYENTNITVCSDLNQIPDTGQEITIILLLDVIEHIKDDKAFLSNLLNEHFVNDNTVFLITVPSFQYLFCNHDEYLLHYRRYSNVQLVKLLLDNNYMIKSNGYLFFILLLPRLLVILKEKVKKNKHSKVLKGTDLTTWNGGRLLTNTFKAILLIDFVLLTLFSKLKIKLPGLSNYAICKKKV